MLDTESRVYIFTQVYNCEESDGVEIVTTEYREEYVDEGELSHEISGADAEVLKDEENMKVYQVSSVNVTNLSILK